MIPHVRRQVRAGLLPLYLQLYDETVPEVLPQFESFLDQVVYGLTALGVEVSPAEVCRVAPQFRAAVDQFEEDGVDLIITLHLAYSPSIESVDALASTSLPILLLDTTMDHDFGMDVDPARIMFNHGIHGVQDLASMLRRRGKPFEIVAGHVTESNVLARAADIARAAHAARLFRNTRALRIGESFRGMGDFAVSEALLLERFGIHVEEVTAQALAFEVEEVSDTDLRAELESDAARYLLDLPEEVHCRSLRVGLGVRRLLENDGYTAFSMNFLAFDSGEGPVDTVPFLEASKAMARGLGYAGEGDVLTAALVGALNGAFGRTTFTEIFCPDWRGNALFLSHMGEVNPEVAVTRPRIHEKPFPFTPAQNPAILTCPVTPGPAALVNLAPGPHDAFGLIAAPVEVLGDATHPAMRDAVRTWIRPACPVAEFLERYSRHGGTHHSALALDVPAEAVLAFARMLGLENLELIA
jgi:L-arabinose isomerase